MSTIIQEFKTFKEIFPKILDMSGYKMEYLAERISMKPPTFSKKKKENKFELDEMQALMDIVWNDYLEDKFLGQAMLEGKESGHLTNLETSNLFKAWK